MDIRFFPAGDENTASSRIRVYALNAAIQKLGVKSKISTSEEQITEQVVVIQKKANEQILAWVKAAKLRGALIVYDIDDLSSALDYWIPPEIFKEMIQVADIITTDTLGHQNYITEKFGFENVIVIPDSIDYNLSHPLAPLSLPNTPIRIMWFGSSSNIQLFQKYAAKLCSIPNVKVVISTTISSIPNLQIQFPSIEYVEWTLDQFPQQIRSCHLTCLMHDGTEIDRSKSNNKMICSIALGVPALVSFTPEYMRTARAADVYDSIFMSEENIVEVVKRYRSENSRKKYLETAQPFVWDNYSPDAIAKLFLEKIEEALLEKNTQSETMSVKNFITSPVNISYKLDGELLISLIKEQNPNQILNLGLAYPKILQAIVNEFTTITFESDPRLLQTVTNLGQIVPFDITLENMPFLRAYQQKWDITLVYGFVQRIIENPIQTAYLLNNLLMLTRKKIFIWDTEKNLMRLKQYCNSEKIQYCLAKDLQ